MCRRVLALLALMSGCIEANLVECGDSLCPQGSVCVASGCATMEQMLACRELPDLSRCTLADELPGQCLGGACRGTVCGDGTVNFNEACDDGNTVSGDGCAANCASTEVCGNGVLDPGEACDDNNVVDADGCQHDCAIPRCGDLIVDALFGEVCDDGNTLDGDACAASCRSTEMCGNSVIDRHVGEECDDGNAIDADGCQHDCRIPICGDTILDPGEQCDAGAANSNVPDATCRPDCLFSRCGDSITDSNEICDDGNIATGDGCSNSCRSDETCGNGVVDGIVGEECDRGIVGYAGGGCTSVCTIESSVRALIVPVPLPPRLTQSAVRDSARGVIVIVDEETGDTLELTDGLLIRRDLPTKPAPRSWPGLAYDLDRGVVVMFGGFVATGYTDETWEYDGVTWTLRTPATKPPPMQGQLVYDAKNKKTVLLGSSQHWEWNGTTWTQRTFATMPAFSFAVTYDAKRDLTVMLGSQMWEYDGVAWVQRMIVLPPDRFGGSLVYDSTKERLVLFGGERNFIRLNDAWAFASNTWTELPPTGAPPARSFAAAVDDPARLGIVVVGGRDMSQAGLSDVWTLADTWTEVDLTMAPPARVGHEIVFDSQRGRVVMFGGYGDSFPVDVPGSRTWELVGTQWHARDVAGPSARYWAAMAYDPVRGRTVLFGGADSSLSLPHTWEYDGQTWTELVFAQSPPARMLGSMVYDAKRGAIVLFGGADLDYYAMNDTWTYDGTGWTELQVTNPPPPSWMRLAYDARREVVVGYGATAYTGPCAVAGGCALYELDGSTWTERVNSATPASGGAITYDPYRRVIVVYGGGGLDELWEYDGLTWKKRSASGPSAPRINAAITFDDANRRLVVGLGSSTFGFVSTSFELRFDNVDTLPDRCLDASVDSDGDGLSGCVDPDCWGRCSPSCPPATSCSSGLPRCGDGTCSAIEDYLICAADCPAP